jgi:antitoxin component of MazEF toxin-antitoxin module
MIEGFSKIQKFGIKGMHIYIPSDVRKDSQNPLKVGDDVKITVDGEKMTITPVQRRQAEETGALSPIIHRDD